MSKLHLQLQAIPPVISESLLAVLRVYGLDLVPTTRGKNLSDEEVGKPLHAEQIKQLASEVGRNAAQALISIDSNPENV